MTQGKKLLGLFGCFLLVWPALALPKGLPETLKKHWEKWAKQLELTEEQKKVLEQKLMAYKNFFDKLEKRRRAGKLSSQAYRKALHKWWKRFFREISPLLSKKQRKQLKRLQKGKGRKAQKRKAKNSPQELLQSLHFSSSEERTRLWPLIREFWHRHQQNRAIEREFRQILAQALRKKAPEGEIAAILAEYEKFLQSAKAREKALLEKILPHLKGRNRAVFVALGVL